MVVPERPKLTRKSFRYAEHAAETRLAANVMCFKVVSPPTWKRSANLFDDFGVGFSLRLIFHQDQGAQLFDRRVLPSKLAFDLDECMTDQTSHRWVR